MPPKRRQQPTSYTLKEAIDYLSTTANADASKKNWTDSLTTLVHYVQEEGNAYPYTLRKKEMSEKYANVNIVPIINDIDTVIDIVENQIKSSRDGNPIALDTKKQYYLGIIRATQRGAPFQLLKQIKEQYSMKLKETDTLSNKKRNKNEPKKGNKKYPGFTWEVALKEYDEYLKTHPFTNTEKGKKELRCAVICGLYVLQRPRRVEDYSGLQYYSKKPAERELVDRNIIYVEDGKLFFSIDKFKTRWRVNGASRQKQELLPRYVKEVNGRLATLFKSYFKKWNLKDMSKLTADEKRQKMQYYVFHKETGTQTDAYDPGSFGKHISACMKEVFNNRTGLSVNDFRHMYNTWLSKNLAQFNDEQLKQFSIDVGDTPRELPTNLRYRIQNQENANKEKTEIEGNLRDNAQADNEGDRSVGNSPPPQAASPILTPSAFLRDLAGEQSADNVGDTPEDRADEAQSQQTPQANPEFGSNMSVDQLVLLLGRYTMEIEHIKLIVARRMGIR
jgi:hypothetical protein